jgi:DNA-binding MarR family transcriptional regulator
MEQNERIEQILKLLTRSVAFPTLRAVMRDTKGVGALLSYLCFEHDGAAAGELARYLGVRSSRVANELKSLERKGLLERRCDGEDRRRILVFITPAGRALMEEQQQSLRRYLDAAVTRFGADDTDRLLELLGRFYSVLGELPPAEPPAKSAARKAAPRRKESL